MALELDFSVSVKEACSKICFTELTGAYNADLNPTGWGAPNPLTSGATLVSIVITKPDGTSVTISSPTGLPTSDATLDYEINASTLNSSWTKILDGLYTIVYSLTASGTVYSVTKYVLFSCNIECCVAKLFAKIATESDCACDSTLVNNALYADSLFQGLLAAKGCGNTTAINNLLTKLNKICTASESDCGCS